MDLDITCCKNSPRFVCDVLPNKRLTLTSKIQRGFSTLLTHESRDQGARLNVWGDAGRTGPDFASVNDAERLSHALCTGRTATVGDTGVEAPLWSVLSYEMRSWAL
jgi:hypothetical protein